MPIIEKIQSHKTKLILVTCIAQILILLSLIGVVNLILVAGQTAMVEMTGYDPYDPLRGRYLSLQLKERYVPLDIPENDYNDYQKFYVVLEKSEGSLVYDHFSYATVKKPDNQLYIVCPGYISYDYDRETKEHTKSLRISPNLNTYYLNEQTAKELDKIVWSNDTTMYISLKILNGNYAIDGLIVNGQKY